MALNGTIHISDMGNSGAVVWSNDAGTNRTAATCSPYSLSVLASGFLIEKDCQNKTVRGCLGLGSIKQYHQTV